MTTPKPQLHHSDFQTLLACGERFYRRKIKGEKEPMTTPLVLGQSQHKMAYLDLSKKLESGTLLPDDEIKDLATDTFREQWDSGPLVLDASEREAGIEQVKGALTDVAVDAAVVHHEQLAPTLTPATDGLEWPWVLNAEGYPYDLAGQLDVLEVEGRIRDLKVVKKKPAPHEVELSMQLTIYQLAVETIRQVAVESVWIDALVKPTKTLGTRLYSYQSTRTQEDTQSFLAMFAQVVVALDKGVFMPANPASPWSPCRWCGFAPTCRYYSKRPVTVAQPGAVTPPTLTHPTRSVVEKHSTEWMEATHG